MRRKNFFGIRYARKYPRLLYRSDPHGRVVPVFFCEMFECGFCRVVFRVVTGRRPRSGMRRTWKLEEFTYNYSFLL